MKRVLSSFLILFLIGCGGNSSNQTSNNNNVDEHKDDDANQETSPNNDKQELSFKIDNQEYGVYWSDNKTVDSLKSLVINELTIEMHRYGDFEQVGDIGYEVPTSDERITTVPGDIVIYQSNKLVVFFGSNTWEYTKIGHIQLSSIEIEKLLSDKDVTVTLGVKDI